MGDVHKKRFRRGHLGAPQVTVDYDRALEMRRHQEAANRSGPGGRAVAVVKAVTAVALGLFVFVALPGLIVGAVSGAVAGWVVSGLIVVGAVMVGAFAGRGGR